MTNKYRYPKGTPKAGQFMDAKQGAKLFVRSNFDNISSGELKVKNLSPTEKKIYAGLKGSDFGNRFTFGKNKYYDPSGLIYNEIKAKIKGSRNLTNFYDEEQFIQIFSQKRSPVIDEKNRTLILGKFNKEKRYVKKNGKLLDIVKAIEKYDKKGYRFKLIDIEGNEFFDGEAILKLTQYEQSLVDIAKEESKINDPDIRIKIDYKITFDVYNKEIEINLKKDEPTITDWTNS